MTTATAAPAEAPAEAPWNKATHVQWRHLAARLKAWGDVLTQRRDVLVTIAPAGHPPPPAGVFNHRTTTITLDANQTLPGKPDPSRIDMREGQDRARHPVLAGVLAHEVGHATHTQPLGGVESGVSEWAALLEEPRMEGRVMSGCAEARHWLRASAAHILGTPEPNDPETAARALILFGGRVLAGVLDAGELPDLDDLVGQWLTAEQIAVVGLETARAVAAADGDHTTLISSARRIAAVLPRDDTDSNDSVPDDDCLAHSHGGSGLDPDGSLAGALGRIAAGAARSLRLDAGVHDPSPAAQARKEAAAARREALGADHRSARGVRHHLDNRQATAAELAACRRLERRLRRAQARDVVTTLVASTAPPGRLRTSELVRRAGQLHAGVTPTATPWSSVRRRTVDSPPLILGVALDISGSMSLYADPTALAQWMFARAGRQIGGKVAVATWNNSVSLMPHNTSARVQVPTIGGGSRGLPAALRTLTRELTLDKACGARMVAVVTDADLPNSVEVTDEVAALVAMGVRVLWLTSPDIHGVAMAPPPGAAATILDDPARIGDILGAAAVEALNR